MRFALSLLLEIGRSPKKRGAVAPLPTRTRQTDKAAHQEPPQTPKPQPEPRLTATHQLQGTTQNGKPAESAANAASKRRSSRRREVNYSNPTKHRPRGRTHTQERNTATQKQPPPPHQGQEQDTPQEKPHHAIFNG